MRYLSCGDPHGVFSGNDVYSLPLNMAIEIGDFAIENGGSLHNDLKLPKGRCFFHY